MKKLRNAKGITLIALIITIIVLLILAGITLSTLAGRRGIINQAQNAEKEHTKVALEDITLVTYQSLDNKGNTDTTKLEQGLNDIGATIKSKTENKWTVEQNGYEFEINIETRDVIAKGETGGTGEGIEKLVDMFRQAETDGCTNEDGTCDNPNHLHVGDYVNYQNPTTGTYTITGDKSGMDANQTYSIANNQLNWRVLGIDGETGGLKLIAGSPMKLNNIDGKNDPYLYMYGARAYLYGIQEIDKACEMYKNNHAIKARSVKIDDINELAGIEEEDISTYNIMPILGLGSVAPYGSSYSYTGYTPEGWINGDGKTTVTGEAKGYAYFSNEITSSVSSRSMSSSGGSSELPVIPMPSTRARKMIFDNLDYTHGKDYWLASSGVLSHPSFGYANFAPYAVCERYGVTMAGFSIGCRFSSGGYEGGDLYAVRPVVILKSDITKDQISKIADKTEETWNYNGGEWNVQFKSI